MGLIVKGADSVATLNRRGLPQAPLGQKISRFVEEKLSFLWNSILNFLNSAPQTPQRLIRVWGFEGGEKKTTHLFLLRSEAEELGLPKEKSFLSLSPTEASLFGLTGPITLFCDGKRNHLYSSDLTQEQFEKLLSDKSKLKERLVKAIKVAGVTGFDAFLTLSNVSLLMEAFLPASPLVKETFGTLSSLGKWGQIGSLFQSLSTLKIGHLKHKLPWVALGSIPFVRECFVALHLAFKAHQCWSGRQLEPLKAKSALFVHTFNALCTFLSPLRMPDEPPFQPPSQPSSPRLPPLSLKTDPIEFMTQDSIQPNRAEHAQQVFEHLKQIPACPEGMVQTGVCADICAKLSQAFRALSLTLHPDKNPTRANANAAFVNLSNARDTLTARYKC